MLESLVNEVCYLGYWFGIFVSVLMTESLISIDTLASDFVYRALASRIYC